MKQTEAIHDALKRVMRSSGRTYAEAAKVLKLSEASVKRLLSRSQLSLERLEQLCDWLEVEVADVVQQSATSTPLLTELDPSQEQQLLNDLPLLLLAFLTLNRWSEDDILEVFHFRKFELGGKLRQVERLGLIEVMESGRIKLRAARNFTWRKDGPVQKFFATRILPEFLSTRFDAPGEQMNFVGGMLSRTSVHRVQELMATLAREFDALVTQDLHMPVRERFGVSLFMGVRPWEFSEFTRMRRKPRVKFF
jgi:DNA-binding Xre family transcriptional regulator